jgi:hypothetical protein
MRDNPISKNLNVKKFFYLIWITYSIFFIFTLLNENGNMLLNGNVFWDFIVVFGGIASLTLPAALTGLVLTALWELFDYLKNWLFDK